MRSGVSFPSYGAPAVWAGVTGAWEADYPVTNLADLLSIRRVARATNGALRAFTFILPAAKPLKFIGMAHHNADKTSTMRIRLFSDNNPDPVGNAGAIVHDSAVMNVFPTGAAPNLLNPQLRPYLLNEAVTARSGRIDLSANSNPWVIGGFELSGFWEWTDVAVPRAFGVASGDSVVEMANSVNHTMAGWSPRIVSGARASITQAEADTTALDFQLEKKTSNPFVWVWDAADPSTWDREAFLVTNNTLPVTTALAYPKAAFSFDFKEHLR